jgi:hypothetical protein
MESEVNEMVPACQTTPNPSSVDFTRIFRKDIVRLVETSNIHKHSATCYKYSKGKSNDIKTCRMRMPRALVKNSSVDPIHGLTILTNGSLVLADPIWTLNSFVVATTQKLLFIT